MNVLTTPRPDGSLVIKFPLGEDAFQIVLGKESTWQYLVEGASVQGFIPRRAVEEIVSWAKGESGE